MTSPILGLGLAVFGYRERAVILLTALFLGLQNSKVDPYHKTCKMQLYRHTCLLLKTSRFLDNSFIEAPQANATAYSARLQANIQKIILPTAPRISKLTKIKKHKYRIIFLRYNLDLSRIFEVVNTLVYNYAKPTTSRHGTKVAESTQTTVKCFAAIATDTKAKQWYFNKKQAIILPNDYSKWGRFYSPLSHVNMFLWKPK